MRTPDHHDSRRASAARVFLAGSAVILVLALIASFVLIVHMEAAPGQATPTQHTTIMTLPGGWVEQDQLNDSTGTLVVTPADPRIVYRVLDPVMFQRSDNGGNTWRTYSIPGQSFNGISSYPDFQFNVSPLNANVIFVSSSTFTPNYTPIFQYVSTDGGSSWTVPELPVNGTLGEILSSDVSEISPLFVAQGNRLYSALTLANTYPTAMGFRLVTSTDGVHWNLADAPLVAQNLTVAEYVATPTGSTLFATTLSSAFGPLFSRELWRSDDAGAHWSNLGQFPETQDPQGTTFLFSAGFMGTNAVVYYATAKFPEGASYPIDTYQSGQAIASDNVYASLDNGSTWQAAPSADPLGTGMVAPWYLGTTSDGSLIVIFDTRLISSLSSIPQSGSIAFAAWRPGMTNWRVVSPPLAALPEVGPLVDSTGPWLIAAHMSTPSSVWALTQTGDGDTFDLWSYALQT